MAPADIDRGGSVAGKGREPDRDATKAAPAALQTLDRGLLLLDLLARHPDGMSVAQLAGQLGIHRAIAYRLAATLEQRAMVSRGPDGQLRLGVGVLTLARAFQPQLRAAAHPLLQSLANDTECTAFLSVAEGGEGVATLVCEPRDSVMGIAYRVGSRHPLDRGAAGIAILSGREPAPGESEAVLRARRDGYSLTYGQLQKGAVGLASPIRASAGGPMRFEASVGVVALIELDADRIAPAVTACAMAVARALGG
jgi:DNA-binding IclR family transcriptional regulator